MAFRSPFSWMLFGALWGVLLVSGPGRAFGQIAGTASVQGTVQDPSAAVVANATVSMTSVETHAVRSTVTDAEGRYSLPNLPVGGYTLDVTAQGFQSYQQSNLVLEVGNNVQINVSLKVGSSSERVEVEASGTMLQTEESSFKQVIDQARITQLPLNGRQATDLIVVSGGAVTAPSADLVGSKTYYSSTAIAVAGGQGNYNNYQLDGGTHVDTFTNVNLPYPFPDALREFSVETNSLPARNGIHPGGLINVVTQSGGNKLHGTAFEFLRNNIINATNFFSTTKDTLKRNQFGGTLGGPILKDRLFFFGGYQATRNRQKSSASSACVPTAAMLGGDFSTMGGSCPVAAAWGTGGKKLVDPVDGSDISTTKKIPTSHLNQQALNLAKYLPAPEDQYGFVHYSFPVKGDEDQFIGRIDWTVNSNHSLFGRYFLTDYRSPAYFNNNLLLTSTPGNLERVQSFVLGETYTITPKLVNSIHGTWTRRRDNRGPAANGINASSLGVQMYNYVSNDIRLVVSNKFNSSCGTCSPGHFNVNTFGVGDDIDWLKGKHQIAFGGEVWRTQNNNLIGYLENGNFTFSGNYSGAANNNVGEPMIDFLTGQMSAFSQSRSQQLAARQTIFSFYVQDTIHLNRHLVVNAGVRWEPMLFPQDYFGRGSTFDFNSFVAGTHSNVFVNAPAGSFYYGDPGVPKSFTNDRWNNFSPRIGVTLDPTGNGKSIFRVGAAIMYDSPGLFTAQRLTSNPPYTNEIDRTDGPISFANPWAGYTGGNQFPGTYPPGKTSSFPTNTLYIVLPREVRTPTINQWTASWQESFARGWEFTLSYLGNKTTHLYLGKGINPATYIPGSSTTSNTNKRTKLYLLNPTQGAFYSVAMTLLDDEANANYNAMLTSVQHRMSNNFSILANYTWSHCISPADANGDVTGNVYMDPNRPYLDRAVCGFDRTHIFNTTAVAASNFSSLHGWTGRLVNGWQIAPLFRVNSGAPLNVTSGVDLSRNGMGLDRPNIVPGVNTYTGKQITRDATGNRFYLNKSAFSANAVGTFGNLGRNSLRMPKTINFDVAVSRAFPIREGVDLNLRLESFNVLNHVNFTTFTTALNSGTFGYATAAGDPRIFQASAKFTF